MRQSWEVSDIINLKYFQEQTSRGVLRKRTPILKWGRFYRSAISLRLQNNFIEMALQHGCSPLNLLHIFRTLFPRNISEWLLLYFLIIKQFLSIISLRYLAKCSKDSKTIKKSKNNFLDCMSSVTIIAARGRT